jgi:hypothetical protein
VDIPAATFAVDVRTTSETETFAVLSAEASEGGRQIRAPGEEWIRRGGEGAGALMPCSTTSGTDAEGVAGSVVKTAGALFDGMSAAGRATTFSAETSEEEREREARAGAKADGTVRTGGGGGALMPCNNIGGADSVRVAGAKEISGSSESAGTCAESGGKTARRGERRLLRERVDDEEDGSGSGAESEMEMPNAEPDIDRWRRGSSGAVCRRAGSGLLAGGDISCARLAGVLKARLTAERRRATGVLRGDTGADTGGAGGSHCALSSASVLASSLRMCSGVSSRRPMRARRSVEVRGRTASMKAGSRNARKRPMSH